MKFKSLFLAFSVLIFLNACDTPEEKYEDYIQRGHEYYENQDYSKARLEYKNASKMMPSDHRVIYYLGLVEEAQGDLQNALSAYRTAEQQDPDYVPALLKVAEFYLTAQIYDEALKRIEKILELEPENAAAHAMRGSIYLSEKNFEQAQNQINTAFEIDPDNMIAYSVQAGLYTALNQDDKAIQILDKAITAHPSEISFYLLNASLYSKQNNIDGIIKAYESLFQIYPEQLNLRYDLASILLEKDRINQAENIYRQTVSAFPDSLKAKTNLVRFLETEKDFDSTEQQIKQFISNQPDQKIFPLWLSELYINNGRGQQAVAILKSIISQNPDNSIGLNASTNLARIELGKGEMALAEKLVDQVLKKDLSNNEARLLKADLAFQNGDYQKAVSELRSLLQDGSNSLKAYRILAETLLAQNRLDLALDTLIQASTKHPQNTETLVRLAQLYALRNNVNKAEEILQAVSLTDPTNPLISETMARIAIDNNDLDKAAEAIEKLKDLKNQELTAYYLEGRLLEKSGSTQQATVIYKDIIQNHHQSPLANYALSSLMKTIENEEELNSIKAFLLSLEDKNATLYTIIGEIENTLGNPDNANTAFQDAIDLNPQSQKPYISLARNMVTQNKIDQAIKILQQAHERVPTDIGASMIMAELFVENNQTDKAIKVYETVLKANINKDIVANNYAQTVADYQSQNPSALDKARLQAERFINSDNAYFLDTLGWVYYRQGKLTQAQPILARAVSLLDEPNAQIAYHYGATLYGLGRKEESKEYLQQAVNGGNYPGKDDAINLFNSLN